MRRELMLLLVCWFFNIGLVSAQSQKVAGVVISAEDGLPVVGASVLVKGTQIGTITDIDGILYRHADTGGGCEAADEHHPGSRRTAD